MTRIEKMELFYKLLELEEENDIGNLTSIDRAEFQLWATEAAVAEHIRLCKEEQEPKTGHWNYTDAYPHWVCCDKCKTRFIPNKEWIKAYNIPTNYCPNCGCRMESEVTE